MFFMSLAKSDKNKEKHDKLLQTYSVWIHTVKKGKQNVISLCFTLQKMSDTSACK